MKKSTGASLLLRDGFNQKLLGYSATAGAALMLAPASEAQTFNITLFNHGGGPAIFSTPPTLGVVGYGVSNPSFIAKTAGGNHAIAFGVSMGLRSNSGVIHFAGRLAVNGVHSVLDLGANAPINGRPFAGTGLVAAVTSSGSLYGNFAKAGSHAQKSGYVGFKTGNGDYGWLKIQVTNNANGHPASITFLEGSDGLYGQIGDSSVRTNGVSAIPEPATVASGLGLLALGAAGVREMRRRRPGAERVSVS